jgi:hypothetical protein
MEICLAHGRGQVKKQAGGLSGKGLLSSKLPDAAESRLLYVPWCNEKGARIIYRERSCELSAMAEKCVTLAAMGTQTATLPYRCRARMPDRKEGH